jgi:hypothetical protein
VSDGGAIPSFFEARIKLPFLCNDNDQYVDFQWILALHGNLPLMD